MSLVGTVVGDYKILKKIGAGGMGVVYKGIHVRLEQEVAIKDLSPDLSSNPEMRERFIREAKIQARLNHPNVVNVHNLIEKEGQLFLVMEFVEGSTLDQLIQEQGALPVSEAVRITRQVLDALSFMHSKGVIHRDLKPGNIMITPDGRVKVTDFGIAKAATEPGHTRAGVRLGTLWYMSPEQVKGKQVDARSDLYAMGITLFQMVTGKLPFFGNSDFEIMKAHTETPPPDPKKIKKDLPKSLREVILKLLEKDPNKRYQTAKEALKALDAVKEVQVKAPKEPSPKPGKSVKKKDVAGPLQRDGKKISPLIWIIIAILLLGATIVVITYWVMNRQKSIIPVVKAPAVEKKVTSTFTPPPPKPKAGTEKPAGEPSLEKKTPENGPSEENVTPVIEEIEKDMRVGTEKEKAEENPEGKNGTGEIGETELPPRPPKETKEISPGGTVVEMTPSGELIEETPEKEKKEPQKTVGKKSKPHRVVKKKPRTTGMKGNGGNGEPSASSKKAQGLSSGGEVVEMTPSGELKQGHKKKRRAKKRKSPRHTQTAQEKGKNTGSATKQKKKKNKDEVLTIDKQIGHFFKSIQKSLKELEHPKGTKGDQKKEQNNEENAPGMEGAFPNS